MEIYLGRQRQYSRNEKDENGNRLFTDDQARFYGFWGGSADAAIEMANFGVVTKSLKGTPHAAQVFKDIIGRTGSRILSR